MREQPFLHTSHRLYLIHILIKLHEDIPNDYWVKGCTGMKNAQNKQQQKQQQRLIKGP